MPGGADTPPVAGESVAGFRLGTARAGVRHADRDDLVVAEIPAGAATAVVMTRNRFRAAPVQVVEDHLARTAPRYLLINTGCANAGTGAPGLEAARRTCAGLAERTGRAPEEVLPFSTGVIGEPLPVDAILRGIPDALADLREDGWSRAAWGIHTTDTRQKLASRRVRIGDAACTVTGMAKGSGMIRPDMATMLAYVATDAKLSTGPLQESLHEAVGESLNRVTVDGDTSTNDACVLVATGKGPAVETTADRTAFQTALNAVCVDLARQIAADGEGATRLVDVDVAEARDTEEAERVAFTVAESPLVKTALAAGDPNWGRILAAVGRAGVDDLAIEGVSLDIGDAVICRGGMRAEAYDEAHAEREMNRDHVRIALRLGRGTAQACVWTCDLTAEYVRINAEYRT